MAMQKVPVHFSLISDINENDSTSQLILIVSMRILQQESSVTDNLIREC